ncbi:hypothetical protein NIES592_11605 [Fischerella major NIES-592]|uniref:Uncharacterized protein n=2 Tax=Fischerella TaxID=1190 RepID=A0A1U7GZN9_9CYAN|nr:hypothetical protein [Fischerella major]OKH13967.1 hypothetical protein NIES592_11605 [Fischerella major NIES-592]PMB47709.1 hypothetical protein CEN41_03010 [Fischerella thermalis CCMEE 5330]
MRSPKVIGDVGELTPHLHKRAQKKLTARGQKKAEEMKKILEEQRDRTPRTKAMNYIVCKISSSTEKSISALCRPDTK